MENDGDPAVFASPFADVAIFHALMQGNEKIGNWNFKYDMNDNGPHFSATKNLLENARNIRGQVYVLDKQKFHQDDKSEFRSQEPVVQMQIIEVTVDDLPPGIEILELEE